MEQTALEYVPQMHLWATRYEAQQETDEEDGHRYLKG